MSSQVIINGITAGSVYALVAMGFGVIYGTTRFFHFAHGIVYTMAAYILYATHTVMRMPLYLSVALAIATAMALGAVMEISCYRLLRRRGASPLVLLIASLGMYIAIQNTISAISGDDTKAVRSLIVREGLNIFGGRVTPIQMVTITITAVVVGCMALIRRTWLGKQLRSVASDAALAQSVGVAVDRMYLVAFLLGSSLAGAAAILVAFDSNVWPGMGFNAMMTGVVALIIGGMSGAGGAVVGGLALGLVQSLVAWRLGTDWQDMAVFAVLILFFVARPQGVMGEATR